MRLAPVVNLNGTWEMQPEKHGFDRPKYKRWCEVPVPMPWTAFLGGAFGVHPAAVPGRMAWFRRRVAVPDIPPQSRLLLHFDAVNFYAAVFVNQKRCGEHVGDSIPFDIDITDFVRPGEEAELLVGVQDISFAEIRQQGPGSGSARKLLYPGLAHHPGIWGDVSLRIVPELHVAGVRVRTELPPPDRRPGLPGEGHIRVTVSVHNGTGRPVRFSLTNEVYDGARQALAFAAVRGTLEAGEQTDIDMGTTWDAGSLWQPDSPHRYTLRTALWSEVPGAVRGEPRIVDEVVDRVHTPVGFREFRADGARFTLNNVPVQLRSESLCPLSGRLFGELRSGAIPRPVSAEEATKRLAALKAGRGLNAVRFHRLPPSPALLDAADRAGLLVVVEFPLPDDELRYAVDHPTFWANARELARRWVLAHAHHPSVVMWSIDQGMVRRYGPRVIEGLRSLAQAVTEVDPTRPVEFSGDAGVVERPDEATGRPMSVFFPPTRVAFRTAGPYEPDAVHDRVLPGAVPPETGLPARHPERPLCLLEHARRSLTPGSLAFFLGDSAYAPGVDLSAASAPLAALELGACRAAGVAAVNTVGRPPPPEGAPDPASDVVALPTRLFANFYAGTRLVESLVLRNDTRFDQDCDLVCRFATGEGAVTQHHEELLLAAGEQRNHSVAFQLPDIRDVRPADRATSELAELCVELVGTRAGRFEHRRKIALWPRVRATGKRRIGLYDPSGRTATALSAVGVRYAAAHGAPHDEFDTILVGEHALDEGGAPAPEAIRAFVEAGGLAVVLAQRNLPYDLSPVTLVQDEGRAVSITFVRDGEHHVLQGLSSFEMRWWQDDHRVATACLRKPAFGNFRCLLDAGGPGGLRWAAAVEVFHGRGSYLFSQLDLVEKVARAPVAGLLLARLADAVPSWRLVSARTLGGDDRFARVGAACPALTGGFGRDDLEGVQVVLLVGADLARLPEDRLRELRRWVRHGGCLYVHDLEPGQEAALNAVTPHEVKVRASPQERLVFAHPGRGLARGLSSADLYFLDHGGRMLGDLPRRIPAAKAVVTVKGDLTGVAATVESPVEYALVTLHAGKGRVVVDQVRWDVETSADSRPARYVSTLLTNLGVPLVSPDRPVPSAVCEMLDLSAVCNATLVDPVPRDGKGWTDRGPDSDLGAFSPGRLLAAGVPFRVGARPGREGAHGCVLRPDGPAATAPIPLGRTVRELAFLVACEGPVRSGRPVAHFTVRYANGLETQVPLRYGVDVLDWNERGRHLEGASLAWKGVTLLGEPAAIYAKRWENPRPLEPVTSVTFSSARTGATPILLAITARI